MLDISNVKPKNFRKTKLASTFAMLFTLTACGGNSGLDTSSSPSPAKNQSSYIENGLTVDLEKQGEDAQSDRIDLGQGFNTSQTSGNTTSTNQRLYEVLGRYEMKSGIFVETVSAGTELAELLVLEVENLNVEKHALFADTANYLEMESYEISSQRLIDFQLNGDQLEITNWIPRDLQNVLVTATIDQKEVLLMRIETLPGLNKFKIDAPWTETGIASFRTADGQAVDASALAGISETDIKFLPQTQVQEEIDAISINWAMRFPDRVMNGKSDVCRDRSVVWRPTRPQDGRYLLTFMIHAAQTLSDPKFYRFWMNTPFRDVDGGIPVQYVLDEAEFNTYSDKEKALYDLAELTAGHYYNKAHRQMVYDKYVNKVFDLGMTGGGGLGGGSTVGLNHNKIVELIFSYGLSAAEAYDRDDWYLPEDDKAVFNTPWNIFGHETGHALGFGHKQTYNVRNRFSHITVGTIVYSHLLHEGRLIVTPDTMIGRDTFWEAPYNKKAVASKRSRPRCGDAYEWGGAYPRHDYPMPPSDTVEFDEYVHAHTLGEGLEYVQELNLDPSIYYSWF